MDSLGCPSRKKILLTLGLSVNTINYVSIEKSWNAVPRKKTTFELDLIVNRLRCKITRCSFEKINRASSRTAQVNFTTISILRGWSSKSCGDFSILLFVAFQFSCLVCLSKRYRFRKTEFDSLGVFWPNFKFHTLLICSKKARLLKNKARFLHPKFWKGNHMWINVSI